MEVMKKKEGEKIVIVKPVASRPNPSSLRSFAEILTREANPAPPAATSPEVAAAPIRPKTSGLVPIMDPISAQTETAEPGQCFKSNVVYRPMAKRASAATASVLKNSGSSNLVYQREVAEIEGHVQQLKVVSPSPRSTSEGNKPEKSSKMNSETEEEQKSLLLQTNNVDRLAYDGYNWRKYGQKHVKGSEYPRSYYKCTYPNCPVKKNVERSLEGQIAEIVYKGEHNHPKPQPFQRGSSERQGAGHEGRCNQQRERNEGGCTGRAEAEVEVGSSGHSSSTPSLYCPVMAGAFYTGAEYSCGLSEECDAVSKNFDAEGDGCGHKGKRRKNTNRMVEVETLEESAKDPSMVVRNLSDSEVLGDGFHWRKYGQKVVKGNVYPRSYYRCTSMDCTVRKYVERTSDEPGAFMTTYEGRHNH